ncbi:hypothetical protein [Paenibacillus sp. FSL E2-0178]|uniref:hypothetical protein n=1 Tax=Paenibacillus sp. FSL E2-0178 TaxID=2921361 RepID=UPI003159604D
MERGDKLGLDDMEWQRKTCQHIIRIIKDEKVLLDEALHPKVVKATIEFIDILMKMV